MDILISFRTNQAHPSSKWRESQTQGKSTTSAYIEGPNLLTSDVIYHAEQMYQQALTILEQELGPEHRETIGSIGNLAGILDEKGDPTQAESLYQQALMHVEHILGPDDPDTALANSKFARF